jgi:transcription termination/antitermination protein NusA
MANPENGNQVDLSESSVYTDKNPAPASNTSDDFATDTAIDRLEMITGGADEPNIAEGELGQKLDELDASTEEELDALEVNLLQDDERPNSRDGSGLIVDDAAEERIARFTEADPMQSDLGAISVVPGRDDTSSILRRHHPDTSIAGSDAIVEGNLDEPMDDTVDERKVDEGTAG